MGGVLVAVDAGVGADSVGEGGGMLGLAPEQATIARAVAATARETATRRMGGV